MKPTTYKVLIGGYVTSSIHGRMSELAWRSRRSISAELRLAIEKHLAEVERERPAVAA